MLVRIQVLILFMLFFISATACATSFFGLVVLKDSANVATYASMLAFVIGKWTGLAGAALFNNSPEKELEGDARSRAFMNSSLKVPSVCCFKPRRDDVDLEV